MSEPYGLILPAAGTGSRSGGGLPKQYRSIAGQSLISHTVAPFLADRRCRSLIVVVDPDRRADARRHLPHDPRLRIVNGGEERQDSIANGLRELGDLPLVLVHDAARPCIDRHLVDRLLDALREHDAVIPVVPVADTVKRIDAEGVVVETVDRRDLRRVQTPQGFRRELLDLAYRRATSTGFVGTDDASLVEALGVDVATVPGDPSNLKVTWPHDLAIAEATLLGREEESRKENSERPT